VSVRNGASFSIDQVLIPGKHTGYQVYNSFDTGAPGVDPDIDPDQTANSLDAPKYRNALGDGPGRLDYDRIIVCVSDHDDAGQNEPYAHFDGGAGATDGVNNANEVFAKNVRSSSRTSLRSARSLSSPSRATSSALATECRSGTRWPT
jgi:hypothetical protein